MSQLVERLLESDWHDPECPFKERCYCEDGAPHDRVMHPLAIQAATAITDLEALVGELGEALGEAASALCCANNLINAVAGTRSIAVGTAEEDARATLAKLEKARG